MPKPSISHSLRKFANFSEKPIESNGLESCLHLLKMRVNVCARSPADYVCFCPCPLTLSFWLNFIFDLDIIYESRHFELVDQSVLISHSVLCRRHHRSPLDSFAVLSSTHIERRRWSRSVNIVFLEFQ